MPDVTLPSGLVKPAIGSTLYGSKWNANWDLMDELFTRVSALETLVPANYLPSGTTWSDFVTAYEAAPEPSDIFLPNELITQTAGYSLWRQVSIYGTGPSSGFKILADVSLFGAGIQFALQCSNTTLEGFTIEHDRVSGGSSMRTAAMAIIADSVAVTNLTLRKLKFKNITSTCIINRDFSAGSVNPTNGLRVIDCTVDEWYESFFEHREGSLINSVIVGNVGTTSSRHPNGSVEACTGVLINLEDHLYPGLVENVVFKDNILTVDPPITSDPGCIGVAVRVNDNADHRYHRLFFINNTIDGFNLGLWHIFTQWSSGSILFPGDAYVYYFNNTFKHNGNTIAIVNDWGKPGDLVFIGDNDFMKVDGGQVALSLPGDDPLHSTVIVENPPNRITGP